MRNPFTGSEPRKAKVDPYEYLELPDNYWLPENARALSAFLLTETGQKFRQILRNHAAQSAMMATTKAADRYDAGYAGGIRAAATLIGTTLLQISPSDSESSEPEPEPTEDAAQTLERISP